MTDADEIEAMALRARARAAEAATADDIRTMADRAIDQINTLADEAMSKARQVDVLMQQLADLLERDT